MYLDSTYIVKFYVNEPGSDAVRKIIRQADALFTSSLALAEVECAFHRHMRRGSLSRKHVSELLTAFLEHVESGVWNLCPVTDALLKRATLSVNAARESVPIRASDAIHLTTALDLGEREVWSNDRHMLAAAAHFGLSGRSA